MNNNTDSGSLLSEARLAFENGDFHLSLAFCKKAYQLNNCPKVLKKINKIKHFITENEKENVITNCSEPESPIKEVAEHLNNKAEEFLSQGDLKESLKYFKEVYQCNPCEKVHDKIKQIENLIDSEIKKSTKTFENGSSNKLESAESVDKLIENARECFKIEDYHESLRLLKLAQNLQPSEKIQRRIERLESYINQHNISNLSERIDTQNTIMIEKDFQIPRDLYEKLYHYQQDGIRWLWNLHKNGPGGILADDMGLGKTVQVIAFLTGLFISNHSIYTALIVMPVSVLVTWESELKRWAPTLRVLIYHDTSRIDRLRQLSNIQRHGGIVLTTYGMLVSNHIDLSTDINSDPTFLQKSKLNSKLSNEQTRFGKEYKWNYMILDEAHKIKNPSAKTTKCVQTILAEHYILLTGTAIQNNLKELWSLFNITHKGKLLGTQKTFKIEYEVPITRAREKDCSRSEKIHGQLMVESLRKLIEPFFLRRTKSEVLSNKKQLTNVNLSSKQQEISRKMELVIWIYLCSIQEQIYRDFLQLDEIKELLLKTNHRSPLVQLMILKKLCDHPRLLSLEQCQNLNLQFTNQLNINENSNNLDSYLIKQFINESGKLLFLNILLKQFLNEIDLYYQTKSNDIFLLPRCLIFSQSLKFLDMVEKIISSINYSNQYSHKHRLLRLDGRITKVEDRLRIIQQFEKDKSYTILLLTTQVGGVGLTITSANRVIILDPSWNPATDAQAVDRAYRIGQKSDVIVYRLITCGTVEEKIYRRQIFKDSVIRQTTATGLNKFDLDPYRYFTRQDLRELFSLSNSHVSITKNQLDQLHNDSDRWTDKNFGPHLQFLTSSHLDSIIYGLSFHDLMFSKESVIDPDIDVTTEHEREYLLNRQLAAERAIALECSDQNYSNKLPNQLQNLHLHNNLINPTNDSNLKQLFQPKITDTHRPMLNRPGLGYNDMRQPSIQQQPSYNAQSEPLSSTENEQISSDREYLSHSSSQHTDNNSIQITIDDNEDNVDNSLIQSLHEMSITNKVITPFKLNNQNNNGNHSNNSEDSTKKNMFSKNNGNEILSKSVLKTFISQHQNYSSTPVSHNSKSQNSKFYRSTPLSPSTPSTSSKSLSDRKLLITKSFSTNQSDKHVANNDDLVQSNPSSSNYSDEPDLIHMDISMAMGDAELINSVNMKSIHEVLAKSGLFDPMQSMNANEVSMLSYIQTVDDNDGVSNNDGRKYIDDNVNEKKDNKDYIDSRKSPVNYRHDFSTNGSNNTDDVAVLDSYCAESSEVNLNDSNITSDGTIEESEIIEPSIE